MLYVLIIFDKSSRKELYAIFRLQSILHRLQPSRVDHVILNAKDKA